VITFKGGLAARWSLCLSCSLHSYWQTQKIRPNFCISCGYIWCSTSIS